MEPTQITKIAPFVVASVIEENNAMCSVIIVDTVGRSPIPVVIYNVEGELDYSTTEDDNRQNLDDTQKLDDGMMLTRGKDGKQKHLLQEVLPIFAQEGVLHHLIV